METRKVDPGYEPGRIVGDVTYYGYGWELWLHDLDTGERLAIRLTPQNRAWVADIISKLAGHLADES